MSQDRKRLRSVREGRPAHQSRRAGRAARLLPAITVAWLSAAAPAAAHGPVNPSASSFLATVRRVPAGVRAIVGDGDQRIWMSVAPDRQVVVLDHQGRPYLRFTWAGVEVNENSSMYYLNQVPPEPAPTGVGRPAPPQWSAVSHGHSYDWHDGRLHALAATAVTPGTRYLGSWAIPLDVDGSPARLTGGVLYAPVPSIVWFWPIVVALACVLAGLRVRRRELDLRLQPRLGVALLPVIFRLAERPDAARDRVPAGSSAELEQAGLDEAEWEEQN
jgi:hypothetical protein